MNRFPTVTGMLRIPRLAAILLVLCLAPAAASAFCGDGVVDLGETCDLGVLNGDASSCCTAGCELRPGGEICRPAAGVCDVDDACDGTNPECPTAPGRNVALLGTATQSSSLGPDTEAHNAIDGNTSGEFIHGSVTHTSEADEDWWEVDLGSVQPITLVRVWNRTDCCSGRLRDFHLILSDDPFESGELAPTLAQSGVTAFFHAGEAATATEFNVDRSARYVRIQQLGEVLQLAEVQVFETSDDKVAAGTECRAAAGDCDVAEHCDGFDNDCPSDVRLGSDTVCRAAAGVCDPAEFCNGDVGCPEDALVAAGTVCRSAVGLCDSEEVCDGIAPGCPDDVVHPEGFECRPRADLRDFAETCDGALATCPFDVGLCAGQFDPTFAGGVVLAAPDDVDYFYYEAVLEHPDGRTLGIGGLGSGSGNDYRDYLTVTRHRRDGSLDPHFGDGGMRRVSVFEYMFPVDGIVQPNGRIVALAESYANGPDYGFHLVGVDVDGNLDPGFGTAGATFLDGDHVGGAMNRLVALADGGIVAVGRSWSNGLLLARLDANGHLDSSFGVDGLLTHDLAASIYRVHDAVVQVDGKIVMVARGEILGNGFDFIVLRVHPDGSLDEDFGTGGMVTAHFGPWDFGKSVAVQPDGRIVVIGDSGATLLHRTATVLRYNADGSPDESFGSGGVALAPHDTLGEPVSRGALMPDGSIYAAGSFGNAVDPIVVRVFRGDGTLATEVGDEGFVVADLPNVSSVSLSDMRVAAQGKLVVGGWGVVDGENVGIVARLYGTCVGEAWLGYKAKATKADSFGVPLPDKNQLPKPWSVALEDALLAGAPDGLENFEIGKPQHLLRQALVNAGPMPDDGDGAYVRYAARPAKQGAGMPVGDKFPKALRHLVRAWELENEFGTIRVVSQKARAVLVPTAVDLDASPPVPASADPFLCYAVKATKDITDQTPDGGSGSGKLRRNMQAFIADRADFCALARDGSPAFGGSTAEGTCLVDLGKPVELCNRVSLSAAEAPRVTNATAVDDVVAGTGDSVLCYAVKLSAKLTNDAVAATLGAVIGDKVSPKQAKAVVHSAKNGNPVLTTLGANFPAPLMLDTKGQAIACLGTRVVSVSELP